MVSSLKFKGETKKPKHKKLKSEKIKELENKIKEVEEEGWVSATRIEDLKGPVVIAIEIDSDIACISANSEGSVQVSTNLDILDHVQDVLNTVEPNSVEQVFVLTPLSMGQRDSKCNDFAFKTASGTYLTVGNDGKLYSDAVAIGSNEKFQLELTDRRWIIRKEAGNSLKIKDQEIIADSTSDDNLFTLRIQAQNKYKSPEMSSLLNTSKISTKELESRADRKLSDNEVRQLKQAFKNGKLNEVLLDMKQKWKTDTRC